MWMYLTLAAGLWLGCQQTEVTPDEPIQKQPLTQGGYTAFQIKGKNWPYADYTYFFEGRFRPLRPGTNSGITFMSVVKKDGYVREGFRMYGIPPKTGTTLFPEAQKAWETYSTKQLLPIALLDIVDDDEPRGSYDLDAGEPSTMHIAALDTAKRYVKGNLKLHFVYRGTDATWEADSRRDALVKARGRRFTLEGEFEVGTP